MEGRGGLDTQITRRETGEVRGGGREECLLEGPGDAGDAGVGLQELVADALLLPPLQAQLPSGVGGVDVWVGFPRRRRAGKGWRIVWGKRGVVAA